MNDADRDRYAEELDVLVRAGFFSRQDDDFHLTPAGHRRMVETRGAMLLPPPPDGRQAVRSAVA